MNLTRSLKMSKRLISRKRAPTVDTLLSENAINFRQVNEHFDVYLYWHRCTWLCVRLTIRALSSTTTNPIESNKFYTKSPLRQIQTICRTYWNLLFLFMALPCNHLFQNHYVHTNIACECVIHRFMHIFLYLYNKFCFSTENCMIIIESIS